MKTMLEQIVGRLGTAIPTTHEVCVGMWNVSLSGGVRACVAVYPDQGEFKVSVDIVAPRIRPSGAAPAHFKLPIPYATETASLRIVRKLLEKLVEGELTFSRFWDLQAGFFDIVAAERW